jgi:ATP phosphoribosyltransferase
MKKTLAIPNGGMYAPTIALLAKVGVSVAVSGRKFDARIEGSDIFDRAIIMRAQDMPEALIDGMADAAIYGRDWHEEVGLGEELVVLAELNYARKTNQPVKLVIFSQKKELKDEEGILVTSEFPKLTAPFFKRAKIRYSHGGTEQKVAFGKYDYGVCVVETGDSLRDNGLTLVKTIMVSPTLFVARQECQEFSYFAELLVGGLQAAGLRLLKMNVSKERLAQVLLLLPALEAPTVNQLSNGDMAVETIVDKGIVANLIVKLKGEGVNGILSQELEIVC